MSFTPKTKPAGSPLLRVGVLLDSYTVPTWVAKVIMDLRELPFAEPALVILNTHSERRRGGVVSRSWRRRHHLLYLLYARLDRLVFPTHPDPFARTSIERILADVPVLSVAPQRVGWSDYFPDRILDEIDKHDLDVALRFGFRILRGGALEIARHGVWSYHHDDNRVIRGGPPGFWEVMERQPVTGSVLQVLTERLDAGRVIYRSWSSTHRRSMNRNKAQVYWKSTAFVKRCLTALIESGDPAAGVARNDGMTFRPYAHRFYRKPANFRATKLLSYHALRALGGRLRELVTRKQWFPALYIGAETENASPELFRFTPLLPPADRSWADPFPARHGDGWTIFIEEVVCGRDRGHIAALEVSADGRWAPPIPVLKRPHHLSYPFVFHWRGDTFLMPESAAAQRIEVHRAVRFPIEWALEATFLKGLRVVDPTLHEQDGIWWLFANIAGEEAPHAHDELYLFCAPSPLGPWRPHRRNPIVSDARCARPAGRLFWWRGDLYRPAQDCSHHYGYAVSLQRVVRLDKEDYAEETVSRILPRWYPGLLASHTFNRCCGLTVVDGLRRIVRKPWA